MPFHTTEPPFVFRAGTRPLLISMPHVGTHVPAQLASRLTEEALRVPDTDWHLQRLYDFADALGASVLAATHSRYVVDLNRPPDDQNLYPGQDTTGLWPARHRVAAPCSMAASRAATSRAATEIRARASTPCSWRWRNACTWMKPGSSPFAKKK